MMLARIVLCIGVGLGLAACTTAGDNGGPVTSHADEGDVVALKGRTAAEIRSMLGPPSFTRRDKPAEIWQYRNNVCILDLFLYPEAKSQSVAYYAVRSTRHASDDACLHSFQVAKGN